MMASGRLSDIVQLIFKVGNMSVAEKYLINGKLPVLSVFSGAGGLDLGLEATGIFETRCCLEKDDHSCITLRKNRRMGKKTGIHEFLNTAVVLKRDASITDGETLLRAARLKKGQVAVLAGGPPCQSFSVFGRRRGMEDPRRNLMLRFINYVRELEPEFFWLENVTGLLTVDGGRAFNQILAALKAIGLYKVEHYAIEAADYGVPQFRSRVFIFGSKSGITVSELIKTHGAQQSGQSIIQLNLSTQPAPQNLLPRACVRHAFAGLPKDGGTLCNHVGRKHSDGIKERYQNLRPGQRDPSTRINKLNLDRPSYTIIVGSDKGGGKGHVHPTEPREVTPRESARIQTFPDFWCFSGTSRHPIRQVGNAVPPVLSAVWARHIAVEAFGVPEELIKSTDEMLIALGQQHLRPLFKPEPQIGPELVCRYA